MDGLKSGSIWRGVGLGLSFGLFVASLAQPAVTQQFSSFGHSSNGPVEHWGFDLLLLGWLYFAFACFYLLGNVLALYFTSEGLLRACLGALATFGWLANPSYLMSLIVYKRVSSSLEWSIVALAIAGFSACVIHWGLAPYNVQMHQGVYYWLAAMLVLLVVQMTRTPEPEAGAAEQKSEGAEEELGEAGEGTRQAREQTDEAREQMDEAKEEANEPGEETNDDREETDEAGENTDEA